MTGQPEQTAITKDDVRNLYHSLNEIKYRSINDHLDINQVINFFESEFDNFSSGKFFCEECGAEWSCKENRCTAQCGESRE